MFVIREKYWIGSLYILKINSWFSMLFVLSFADDVQVYKTISLSVCLCVRPSVCPVTSNAFYFDIGIPYLAHINMRRCIVDIRDTIKTLTFDVKAKFIRLWHCLGPTCTFCLLWRCDTCNIFDPLVYHHEAFCCVHSWSWYNVDLWPQRQVDRFFFSWLCVQVTIFLSFDIIIPYI